jgi:hypothetical protein
VSEMNYRIESSHPIVGPLLSGPGATQILMFDRSLAIVVAAKSVTVPYGSEIRVVHVATGEVVFRKTAANTSAGGVD